MNVLSHRFTTSLVLSIILFNAGSAAAVPAAPAADSSFEIYYVAGAKAKAVSKLDTIPFVSMSDIKEYDYRHHSIVLEREAYSRLVRTIPQVIGNAFVVFVNHRAVYGGRFWPLQDQTYVGPFIELHEIISTPDTTPNYRFNIRLFCKNDVCRDADDPRLDKSVQEVFRKAKKLSLTK